MKKFQINNWVVQLFRIGLLGFGFYMLSVLFSVLQVPYQNPAITFANYEQGFLNGREFPAIALVFFVMSCVAWHFIFLPIFVGKNAFLLSSKFWLATIDLSWYIGGFASLLFVLLELNSTWLAERAISVERGAEMAKQKMLVALDQIEDDCNIIDRYIQSSIGKNVELAVERRTFMVCKEIAQTTEPVLGNCDRVSVAGLSDTNESNYMADQISSNEVFNSIRRVTDACMKIRFFTEQSDKLQLYTDASTKYDSDPLDRDPRAIFVAAMLIGLRLVRTTSEFTSIFQKWRAEKAT